MTLPWNTAVDITKPGANEKIAELGQQARDLISFTMYCNEHGAFAWNVPEGKIELEEARHRAGEACWHKLEAR